MVRIVADTTAGLPSALLGSVLQIKPILGLVDGRVEAIERQRTHKRALARLKQLVSEQAARGEAAQLAVMHAGRIDLAETLAAELQSALSTPAVLITDLVPAIVTHAGPGALAVGFFTPEKS